MQHNRNTSPARNGTLPPESPVQSPESPVRSPDAQSRARMSRLRRQLGGYNADARVSQRLLAAQVAIETVQTDARLSARMAARGYDAARMAEGLALHAAAKAQYQHARAHADQQRAANATLTDALRKARATHKEYVQIARVAFRAAPLTASALGLDKPSTRFTADWLLQAGQFYATALASPASVAAFARYGVSAEDLAAAQAQVAAVAAGASAQNSARLATEYTATTRSTAMAALDDWMRDFLAIARVALAQG